jgi:hypothetical protein
MVKFSIRLILILSVSLLVLKVEGGGNPYLRPRNSLYLNLFGDASIVSVNYERLFMNNNEFFMTAKIGAGYSESMGLPTKNTSLLSAPLHITCNYGNRHHYLEIGLGSTFLFYGELEYWDVAVYPILGYRFQPLKKDRVSFRVYASYPLGGKIDIDKYWFSPVGASVGFCF